MMILKIDEFISEQMEMKINKLYSKNSELNDKLHEAMITNGDTIISMIDRLRVQIFENLGLCAIS